MFGDRRRVAVDRMAAAPRSCAVPERDAWVHRLQIAVVKQAADELRAAYRTDDESTVETLCRWFRSEWGQLLSFGQGEAIIRRIKKEEEEREQANT